MQETLNFVPEAENDRKNTGYRFVISFRFQMSEGPRRFEKYPEQQQIAAFIRLFEAKLGDHITDLREFCDSGENIIRFIDACVPGQALRRPKMMGGGDVLKRQQREYALKFAVHRGILTEAEAQQLSPDAMDMNKPKSAPLLRFVQAIAKKGGIELFPFVSGTSAAGDEVHSKSAAKNEQARETQELESRQALNLKRFESTLAVHQKHLRGLRLLLNETDGDPTTAKMQKIVETLARLRTNNTDMLMTFYGAITTDGEQLNRLLAELGREPKIATNVIDPSVILNEIAAATAELQARVQRASTTQRENAAAQRRFEQYARMVHENEAVSRQIVEERAKMSTAIETLNSGIDESTKSSIQTKIDRRMQTGYLYGADSSKLQEHASGDRKAIIDSLIPNLAVRQEVATVQPATIEEIEQTNELILNTDFSLDVSDTNAAFHAFAAIAKSQNLGFVMMPSPPPNVLADAWNKSADFAMENDVLCESSLWLLGSTCPEHQAKGFSIHLEGNYERLQSDPNARIASVEDVKRKLAVVHGVDPSNVVILGIRPGSTTYSYVLNVNTPQYAVIEGQYRQVFGPSFLQCDIHPSFSQLQINPNSFSPSWNRDFRIDSNCPKGEYRGGQPYRPPAGWKRFGMNVSGKFLDGDKWLGCSNVPGEWCIAYHGTKADFVLPISQTPLIAGLGAYHGCGIYCSPNVNISEDYTGDSIEIETRTGTIKCKYVFMCRVNPRAIHHCTARPCPDAQNPAYTLHMTTYTDIWFVNCQNQGYQNIRPYGLLVKET
jgi:hypothetical protein